MPDLWRILAVEDDEDLNLSIVNSLRKDGYFVQGTRSGAEAIRILWSEEFDVVIGDLKAPGADGFEMLQWLRAYRPNTRMIMVAAVSSPVLRTQALEAGVVSYLEKPLNLHQLKEELRRLLQQTGFSASLDSFDLLDVIQIINLSRKNIALLVNTGLEERGILRFQKGELIWAEYGNLRGEEAFFALAAHKNGTVTQQDWHELIIPNVTQPLSRLIFQTLQYRSKYATMEQPTGEQEAVKRMSLPQEVNDDSPFLVLAEPQKGAVVATVGHEQVVSRGSEDNGGGTGGKEWWQQTGKKPSYGIGNDAGDPQAIMSNAPVTPLPEEGPQVNGANIIPSTVRKTPASQRTDLPSWLTDQPTKSGMPMLRPSSLSGPAEVPTVPGTKPPPAEWQPPAPGKRTTEQLSRKQATGPHRSVAREGRTEVGGRRTSSPEWQPLEGASLPRQQSGSLESLSSTYKTSNAFSLDERQESNLLTDTAKMGAQRARKRNYPALVAALQTLGYSITGFIAAAVVSLDGQP
ncbi:MAG: response regulator [Chloroflexi bacterium]|nr:MAG: response regulator [Chloroflexota bacterium]